MDIKASDSEHIRAKQRTAAPAQAQRKGRLVVLMSPLWACLLIALVVRVWLLIHTGGVIDGDEAVLGIQAEHILHGEFPAYFYGQAYMGSLEAYLVALLFAIAGPSVWALRAEPILLSLVVVWLTWKLASLLVEFARLPAPYQQMFKILAALGAAIPPLYDVVLEMRLLGGYIETFVLMLILLIVAFQLTKRRQAGASYKELALYWGIIGFVVGLGIWVNPLIISAVIAAALWIIGSCGITVMQQSKEARFVALRAVSKGLLLAVFAIPACIIGLAPALLWGATHQWANFIYIRNLGGSWSLHRLHVVAQVTVSYTDCIAPRMIGGALTYESSILTTLHWLLLFFGVGCILTTLSLVAVPFLQARPPSMLLQIRRAAALPALFAACSAIVFCTGSASVYALLGCKLDDAGRYATPFMLVLPFFIAAACVAFGMTMHKRVSSRDQQSDREQRSPDTRPIGTMPRGPRVSIGQVIIVVLILAYVVVQACTYILTDAGETFQSNYCRADPANNDPIIAYMQQEHIHYFWANNFLAYPIVFKTDSRIIGVDPAPLLHPNKAVSRLPSYTDAVEHADRPSLLVVIRAADTYPQLLRLLDARHVTYKKALFPAQAGFVVLVVTPLSRTVSPLEPGLDIFTCVTTP